MAVYILSRFHKLTPRKNSLSYILAQNQNIAPSLILVLKSFGSAPFFMHWVCVFGSWSSSIVTISTPLTWLPTKFFMLAHVTLSWIITWFVKWLLPEVIKFALFFLSTNLQTYLQRPFTIQAKFSKFVHLVTPSFRGVVSATFFS